MLLKCVLHVKRDYFSSNQPTISLFSEVVVLLSLQFSMLKVPNTDSKILLLESHLVGTALRSEYNVTTIFEKYF